MKYRELKAVSIQMDQLKRESISRVNRTITHCKPLSTIYKLSSYRDFRLMYKM